MVRAQHDKVAVIEFLVQAGPSSPMDVGVCCLGHRDGKRAWRLLNRLRTEGYVKKIDYATYVGRPGFACAQRRLPWHG